MKPLALALLAAAGLAVSIPAVAQQPTGAAIDPPWTPAQVLTPADLAAMLSAKPQPPPALLHVGFKNFYDSKRIPNSIYAGPGRTDAGLDALRAAVAQIPKDRQIVIYCGCCPWDHCPNMKPAYKVLHDLGYSKIKVMAIPTNFPTDWVDKGYPVEGATASSRP